MSDDGSTRRYTARSTRPASRRAVLQAAFGGAAGLAFGWPALRARPALAQASGEVATRELAADLHVLTVGNANVVVHDRGLLKTRFVVDTAGFVEANTLTVIASSHALFARAALVALRAAQFSPAYRQGQRVRQVVALPFRFSPPPPQ